MSTTIGANRKVTIIGAGFSGLASAYFLSRAGFDVEVFEKSDRVGGLISTKKAKHGLVETAANGFLNSPLVEELFKSLDVPLEGASREARKRFIFRNGQAKRWPIGFIATLRVIWFGVRFAIARESVAPRKAETIDTWGKRVLGSEATHYFLATALQGIYAGEAERMSANLIVGRFFKKHQSATATASCKRSRVTKGSVAPTEGMGQLIDALEKSLRANGVKIHLNAQTQPSTTHPTIVATPASAASGFVDATRAQKLQSIQYNAVATTTAFFEHTDAKSKGFGVLFPPREAKFLGVLKNNFIFSNRGGPFSETWIRSGTASDGQIVLDILSERRRVFGLEENALESVVTNWPAAIPHYTLELESVISEIDNSDDNIFLMGNYLGDLGLAKILERASRWPERLSREGTWK